MNLEEYRIAFCRSTKVSDILTALIGTAYTRKSLQVSLQLLQVSISVSMPWRRHNVVNQAVNISIENADIRFAESSAQFRLTELLHDILHIVFQFYLWQL